MPSRRYYIAIAPIEHLNGKLAPVRVKCKNTTDSEHRESEGFFYGYRRAARPSVTRYAVRTLSRDLNTNPYTPQEEENRTLFTAALNATYAHQAIEEDWQAMLADFEAQSIYVTPLGFAVAMCRQNGGEWPPKWQP